MGEIVWALSLISMFSVLKSVIRMYEGIFDHADGGVSKNLFH
jgi:hypothetical protein